MRHIMRFSALLLACSLMTASLPETSVFAEDTEVFFDDFSGSHLDTDRWLIAQKNWGGKITVDCASMVNNQSRGKSIFYRQKA